MRTQVGKPGAYSFEPVEPAVRDAAREEIQASAEQAFAAYERMLEQGVAKEVARTVLPLAMYTKYFWSCNPRSLHALLLAAQLRARAVRDPGIRAAPPRVSSSG